MSEKPIVAIIFKVPPVWGAAVVAVGLETVVVAGLVVVGLTAVVVFCTVVMVAGAGVVVEVEQLVKIKHPIKTTANKTR
jgi:hypothetical protein